MQACGSSYVVTAEDVEAEDVDRLKRLTTTQVTQVRSMLLCSGLTSLLCLTAAEQVGPKTWTA